MVLKPKIMMNDGPVEFVKLDEKMFDEIEKEMREVENKSHQQAVEFSMIILFIFMFLISERAT